MTTLVLLHSPVLGPSSWEPMRTELVKRGHAVVLPTMTNVHTPEQYVDAAQHWLPDDDLILVAYSGSGVLLPLVAHALHPKVKASVFVDATMPPEQGPAVISPPWLLTRLEPMVNADGLLPPWDKWWPTGAITAIVPERAVFDALRRDMPRVPISFLRHEIDIPAEWFDHPGAYIELSAIYDEDATAAAKRGWPVTKLDLHHLAIVTHTERVADALEQAVFTTIAE